MSHEAPVSHAWLQVPPMQFPVHFALVSQSKRQVAPTQPALHCALVLHSTVQFAVPRQFTLHSLLVEQMILHVFPALHVYSHFFPLVHSHSGPHSPLVSTGRFDPELAPASPPPMLKSYPQHTRPSALAAIATRTVRGTFSIGCPART
jgi:hypothetical protein